MSIKKLAGQTLWYGVPRIFSRFLSFGISLLGFQLFDPNGSYAFTQIYAVIPFLTSYLRTGSKPVISGLRRIMTVRNFTIRSMYPSSFPRYCSRPFSFCSEQPLTSFIGMQKHPEFVTWMILIVFFDSLYTIPMARLRQEERPRKYAFINMFSVILNVAIVLFFFYVAKPAREADPYTFLGQLYRPEIGIGYFIIANVVSSAVCLLLLYKEFTSFRFEFDKKLWKDVMKYSYPLIIVGFGGMINEMLSRLVYQKVSTASVTQREFELGVFGANYKLAVLITIFIQIFRMAAEPFFFNQSRNEGAQRMYARVMKFFVIACCFMFLFIALFLDGWKVLIAGKHPEYAEGLHIVPVLSMASIFLGIYYNLSVWYKLTNKNMTGAYITIAGAVITILLNIWWIPDFKYTGAAWATFCCYLFMMVISYVLGQKYYPIPYAKKKLITYVVIVTLMYILHELIARNLDPKASYYKLTYYGSGLVFFVLFSLLIMKVERKELQRLPFIGKFFSRPATS